MSVEIPVKSVQGLYTFPYIYIYIYSIPYTRALSDIFSQSGLPFHSLSHIYVCVCVYVHIHIYLELPRWLNGKESTANAGDTRDSGSIPG